MNLLQRCGREICSPDPVKIQEMKTEAADVTITAIRDDVSGGAVWLTECAEGRTVPLRRHFGHGM